MSRQQAVDDDNLFSNAENVQHLRDYLIGLLEEGTQEGEGGSLVTVLHIAIKTLDYITASRLHHQHTLLQLYHELDEYKSAVEELQQRNDGVESDVRLFRQRLRQAEEVIQGLQERKQGFINGEDQHQHEHEHQHSHGYIKSADRDENTANSITVNREAERVQELQEELMQARQELLLTLSMNQNQDSQYTFRVNEESSILELQDCHRRIEQLQRENYHLKEELQIGLKQKELFSKQRQRQIPSHSHSHRKQITEIRKSSSRQKNGNQKIMKRQLSYKSIKKEKKDGNQYQQIKSYLFRATSSYLSLAKEGKQSQIDQKVIPCSLITQHRPPMLQCWSNSSFNGIQQVQCGSPLIHLTLDEESDAGRTPLHKDYQYNMKSMSMLRETRGDSKTQFECMEVNVNRKDVKDVGVNTVSIVPKMQKSTANVLAIQPQPKPQPSIITKIANNSVFKAMSNFIVKKRVKTHNKK